MRFHSRQKVYFIPRKRSNRIPAATATLSESKLGDLAAEDIFTLKSHKRKMSADSPKPSLPSNKMIGRFSISVASSPI